MKTGRMKVLIAVIGFLAIQAVNCQSDETVTENLLSM